MNHKTNVIEEDKGPSHPHLTRPLLTSAYLEIETWLATQPARSQLIYRHRLGNPRDNKPLRPLAEEMSLTAERVRVLQDNLLRDLKAYTAANPDGSIARMTLALAQEAGTLFPKNELTTLLDPHPDTANHAGAALKLAGNYVTNKGWYHRQNSEKHNPTDRIKGIVAKTHCMSVDEATTILVQWGMNPRYTERWLQQQPKLTQLQGYLIPATANIANRAYVALRNLGKPTPLNQIMEKSGYQGTRPYLQIAMGQDGRFCRATKSKYGLKEWNLPIYFSLPRAMTHALTQHGGTLPLKELQEILGKTFEVPPQDTAARAGAKRRFTLTKGQVSLGPGPKWGPGSIRLPVGKGLFRISDRQMAILTKVTAKLLAGSPANVTQTVSRVMGLKTEKRYYFNLPDGTNIHLSHHRKSRNAALARLRQPLRALGAHEGDLVTILMDLDTAQARLAITSQQDMIPGWQTVAKLTAIDPATGRRGLAQAMMCQPDEIENMLRLRQDWTVLQALPPPR